MNKTTIIAIISLFTLLISQGYWLYNMYEDFKEKQQFIFSELFQIAIDNEVGMRFSSSRKDPNNLSYTFKRAKDMTPEERNKLKGDTVHINTVSSKNIGSSFSEIFTQKIQDHLLLKKPIRLEMLDTLLNIELEKKNIQTSFMITLYDKDHKKTKHINHAYNEDKDYILTKMHPIGTKGLLFVQAQVALPPYVIFEKMMYAFIISLLIIGITFYCIVHQLYIIHQTRKLLKEREHSVYNAIHDLKAPLIGVFSILNYTETKIEDTELTNFISKGKIQIKKLTNTIESMLGLLKNKTGKVILNKEMIHLPETLKQIEEGLQTLYPDKDYRFTIQNPSGITNILTDASRLERCLRNLIENALKYSDNGVEITALLKEENGWLQVGIQDTGWGIPQKAQKYVGKQLYRVQQKGKPNVEGFGIGLSSVRQLTNELGGKLTFISKEGSGSTFFINLPL